MMPTTVGHSSRYAEERKRGSARQCRHTSDRLIPKRQNPQPRSGDKPRAGINTNKREGRANLLCLLFKHSLKQSILIDPLFRKFYLTFFRYSADTDENGNRVPDRAGCAASAPVGGHVRRPFSPVGKASGSFLLLYLNFYIPYDDRRALPRRRFPNFMPLAEHVLRRLFV